ncbi:spore germination protein [Paenalkalicoccus suaedae]|uniref:Spore germination protein n=1 Tax=Paenalkalicoccus suaedae TaxID=2592382 RepID=A0A859FAF3_9BACI|nr:spore germination protein [Paenalkalicoccus suaedae]
MFWKKRESHERRSEEKQSEDNLVTPSTMESELSMESLKKSLEQIDDAEFLEMNCSNNRIIHLVYIRTLIDQEKLNETIIDPLTNCSKASIQDCLVNSSTISIPVLKEAKSQLFSGCILLVDSSQNLWFAVPLKNPIGRAIETSETETILYGAKDSFTEQIEENITLIRRRLPIQELKTEKFSLGTMSKTNVVLMYIDGVTNPDFVTTIKEKISEINFDLFLDSSQVAAFLEKHQNSIFPQFQQTDRPDVVTYSLGLGKITLLIDNTPFALVAPITFFHLFQSPEDYINRWVVASFLRLMRYVCFILSVTLIPFYVALTTHHYQMIPIQTLLILVDSRSQLPFTPFWEAFIMLIFIEILKEASLRMPTKTGLTLGVIGGIVIGQAAVEAGFASNVLIVMVGISTVASFLIPNYLMTKANPLIQLILLILSSLFGLFGIILGSVAILAHLNSLSSIKQPYFSPVSPFYRKDWNDLFIRGPFFKMLERPEHLKPQKLKRYKTRR